MLAVGSQASEPTKRGTMPPEDSPPGDEPPITLIEPPAGWGDLALHEVWESRDLLFYLAWRDLKVRYRQTFFGVSWALIQPVALTLIFTLIFSRVAGVAPGNVPYPLFVLSGLVPWLLFAQGLTLASNSLVAAEGVITKVYFPRLVLPISAVFVPLLDFLLSFGLLIVAAAITGTLSGWPLLALPAMIALTLVTTIGPAALLAAVNVQYRDVRHALPFAIQFWFFASPVIYSTALIADPFRLLYALNPMVGAIEGFRWALLGGSAPIAQIALSAGTSVVLLAAGLLYFRHRERTFADVI